MDKILKSLVFNDELSLTLLDTTELVNRAMEIHKLSPLSAAALGRTMTVTAFMASNLKNATDKLSVTVRGDGVGGEIVVCGDAALNMRGSIENPRAELPLKSNGHLDVGGCVGKNGKITVVKSMGLKEPYSGSSQLVTGEIGEDFTAYFTYSEQQPTAISLGVKIGKDGRCAAAGGCVLQALPFASDNSLFMAEDTVLRMTNFSSLLEEKGLEGIADYFFGDLTFHEQTPRYRCLCSRKTIEKVLVSLGKAECEDVLKTEGKLSVNCQFCETDYTFTEEDIEKLFR